jgi:branched-chain amino acid transport system substrate-binding protein
MKKVCKTVFLSFVAISILCVSWLFTGVSSVEAQQGPIKIGLMAELSGVYAREGLYILRGVELALSEVNYKIAGRDVKLISEDNEMKPDVAITKARKLVERDKCQILVGNYSSGCALAVRDYAHTSKTPYFVVSGAGSFDLRTPKKLSPYVWLGGMPAGQNSYGLPYYLTKEKGFKKAIIMVPDYAYGRDIAAWYKEEIERAGGKVVQEIFTPFPTLDFAPYIASFKVNEADIVYPDYNGGDAVRAVRQIRELGIRLELASCGSFQPGAVESMNPKDADGGWGSNPWIPEVDTPENRAFMKAYKAKFNDEAGLGAAMAYTSTWGLIHAIRKVKGNVENKEAFLKAFSEVDFKSIFGRFFYEEATHSSVLHNFTFKVKKVGNKTQNEIVHIEKEARVSVVMKRLGK